MTKVVILRLKSEHQKFQNRDAEKLRGFMGDYFRDEILYHNHIDKYSFNYQSSQIFYKVIEGDLAIVGVNNGATLILNSYDKIGKIKIGEEWLEVEKEIEELDFDLKVEDKFYSYRFLTPWFALNQENYKRYKSGEFNLNYQLRNNIIEFFKLSNVWADKKIEVETELEEIELVQKNTRIIGFIGSFKVNVNLPNYIGLGKRKSIGYGTVVKL